MKAFMTLLIAVSPALSSAGVGGEKFGFEALMTATVLMNPSVVNCTEKLNQHVDGALVTMVESVSTYDNNFYFIEGTDDKNVSWALTIKDEGNANYSCTIEIGSEGFDPMALE